MEGSRKRVNKYGRGGRRTIVHDLFDIGTKHTSLYAPVQSSNVSSYVSSRERTPFSDVSEDPDVSRQLKSELLADVDSNRSRLKSPARKLHTAKNALAASTFDIQSSDEDSSEARPAVKAYKRRKLTPNASDDDERAVRGRTVGAQSTGRGSPTKAKQRINPKVRARSTISEVVRKAPTKDVRSHSLKPTPRRISRPRPAPLSPPLRFTPEPRTPPGLGSPVSDTSTSSMVTTRSTTKRKREAADGALSDISSPSQLELSALRLTPQRNEYASSRSGVAEDPETSVSTPPRVRRRLVDGLDSARPSSDDDVRVRDIASTSTPRKTAREVPKQGKTVLKPSLTQQSSHQEKAFPQETIRPRKYGKQRSHLRDMVREVESNSGDSSQRSVDHLLSQGSATTEPQPSQFDFEMISDDEVDAGVQLKSIHELRQAGVVNRYDRDLESVLEDVSSSTKSVRITGLMQLVRKLKEQAFKRHLLDHGKVSKLTDTIHSDLDALSSSIMLLALWTLAHSDSATSHILLQLYHSLLRLPARLLIEERPLAIIAKDRQENLSKALSRDLAEFEAHVLGQSSGTGRQTNHIIASRIAIRSVEALQRRLIGGGEAIPSISRSWLQGATVSVNQHLRGLRDRNNISDAEHAESIRLTLAWLELSEASSGSIAKQLTPVELTEFGTLLADLLTWAMNGNGNEIIEHSCLRLVIAMSNESSLTSEALVSAGVADSVFRLVNEKYPTLASQTSDKSEGDSEELASTTSTSVVLALGCLLDFADSSEAARLDMINPRPWTRVDNLVNFFKLFVQETDEAIDESKAPILLPFGYLSLLLCTLSLNNEIRQHISATIGRSFGEVIDRAAIFLERMRSISLDEVSATSFVDRFSLTLESVRANQ